MKELMEKVSKAHGGEAHRHRVPAHSRSADARVPGGCVPLGGTKPRGGGDTHAGSRGALQQHLLYSLRLSSPFFFFFSLGDE